MAPLAALAVWPGLKFWTRLLVLLFISPGLLGVSDCGANDAVLYQCWM